MFEIKKNTRFYIGDYCESKKLYEFENSFEELSNFDFALVDRKTKRILLSFDTKQLVSIDCAFGSLTFFIDEDNGFHLKLYGKYQSDEISIVGDYDLDLFYSLLPSSFIVKDFGVFSDEDC